MGSCWLKDLLTGNCLTFKTVGNLKKNLEIRRPKFWIHEKCWLHKGKWWRWLHTHAYVIFDSQCGCVVGTCFLELWSRSTNSHCVGAATSYKGEKRGAAAAAARVRGVCFVYRREMGSDWLSSRPIGFRRVRGDTFIATLGFHFQHNQNLLNSFLFHD